MSPFEGPNSRDTPRKKKGGKRQNEREDKNRRKDFWRPTWGAGIKPEDYENEMVLTSNQLELELESKDFDWWEILEITLPPRDLGPTRGYQV